MVHTIDIEDRTPQEVKEHPRIKRFLHGWQGYDLKNAEGFNTILIIEDGSHTYEDTIGALTKLHHLVTPGSYLIVEDGIVSALGVDYQFNGGPLKAIREFLVSHTNFENDSQFSHMFGTNATFNVNGYLKKVS